MNGWPIVGPNGSNAWYDAYDMAIVDPDVHVIIVTGSGRDGVLVPICVLMGSAQVKIQ